MKRARALLLLCLTFLLTQPSTLSAKIRLSEIMYNPVGDDSHTEYIELQNVGQDSIDMTGWQIGDGDAVDLLTLMLTDDTTPQLAPGAFALIFEASYFSDGGDLYGDRIPDGTMLLLVSDAAIGSGGLLNSVSETVRLLDADGHLIDTRSYRPDAEAGVSEERILPEGGNKDDNWSFSVVGGTPGMVNSVTPHANDLRMLEATISVDMIDETWGVTLSISVENNGTDSSGVGRVVEVMAADGLGAAAWTPEQNLPLLAPGEIHSLEFSSPLESGSYDLAVWFTPGDDNPANDTLRDHFTIPYLSGVVIVSEVMAAPPSAPDVEWFELENRTADTLLLNGWSVRDAAGNLAQIESSVPLLAPGDFLLVAEDSTVLVWPDMIDSVKLFVPQSWPSLNNGGDSLLIYDLTGTLIEAVDYPVASEGISLQRRLGAGGEPLQLWDASTAPYGGTPGWENVDLTPAEVDLALAGCNVSFGPGDGGRLTTVTLEVENRGTATSGFGRTLSMYVLANDMVVWQEEEELTTIMPGELYSLGFSELLSQGDYHLTAMLSPEDELPESDTLQVALTVAPPMGELFISELMAAPPAFPDAEWIELENLSSETVPLAGWTLTDETGNRVVLDSLAPVIGSGELLVMAEDSSMLDWPGLSEGVALLVPSNWASLNNGGDSLTLFNDGGVVVDAARYSSTREGVALQRLIASSGEPLANWAESPDPSGGTPGAINPPLPESGQAGEVSVVVDPKVICADGDGRDETVIFFFRFPSPSASVTLRLFDRIGRPLGTLLDGRTFPGITEWEWDGHAGLRRSGLPVGIYIWHVRAVADDGRHYEVKGTLVSAGY